MRKTAMLVVFGLLVLSSRGSGTQTRINGLGVENWMLEDDYNIWLNPAGIVDYSNMVWGELGEAPAPIPLTQWLGGSWSRERLALSLGIFFARPYGGDISEIGSDPLGGDLLSIPDLISSNVTDAPAGIGDLSVLSPENKFDLFCGYEFRKKFKAGVRFNLNSDNAKEQHIHESASVALNDGEVSNEQTSRDFHLNIGFVLPRLWFISKLGLATELGFPSVKNMYDDKWWLPATSAYASDRRKLKSDGTYNLDTLARGMIKLGEKHSLWSMIKLRFADFSSVYSDVRDVNADAELDVDTQQERDHRLLGLNFGGAWNVQYSPNLLMIVAAKGEWTQAINNGLTRDNINGTITEEYKWTGWFSSLPLNFAVEWTVSKWAMLRLGVRKRVWQIQRIQTKDPEWQTSPNKITDTSEDTKTERPHPPISVSMGFGMNPIKNLFIDAVINQDVLFSGTWLISGVSERPITQITLSYRF